MHLLRAEKGKPFCDTKDKYRQIKYIQANKLWERKQDADSKAKT